MQLHCPATTPCALILMLAALAPLSPVPAAAQERDSVAARGAVIRMEALRVQAVRPLATVGGTSGVEVQVDSLGLPAAPSLEAVMREIPMLHVRTNSRGEAEVVARGSESRQVAVLMDGIPLTLTWDARADVSVVPASAPRDIRFFRGMSSVLHGPNTLGGVVELVTAGEHMTAPRALQLTTGIDETGGHASGGSLTLPWAADSHDWLLRAGAGFRDSPGATLARGVSEPLPDGSLRRNTDTRSGDGFVALRYRAERGAWLSLSGMAARNERGIAAELEHDEPRFWRYPRADRAVTVLSGGSGFHETPLGIGDIEASVGYDLGRTEIEAYADRTYDAVTSFENGDDRTFTMRLLADHTLGERGDFSVAFTHADILHDEELAAASNRYRQRLWSLGAETVWLLAAELGPLRHLRLSLGAVHDAGSTPETGDKPAVPATSDWGGRVGLTARLGAGATTTHLGVSRRGRFPALRESFSGALDRFAPNPALTPEHLRAIEAGVTTPLGPGQLQVVGFYQELADAIVRITLPDRRFMRVNENAMRTRGLEVVAVYPLGDVTLGGDIALQDAILIQPRQADQRPENQPAIFGSAYARSPLPLDMVGSVEARFTGSQYCLDPGGATGRLDGGTRISADAARTWQLRRAPGALLSRLEARFAVDNVADTALFDQCGLPQPGRLARVQFRIF